MVLRGSAESLEETLELAAIVDPEKVLGIAGDKTLLQFADAVIGNDPAVLESARVQLLANLGEDALIGAAAVVANFSRNDRIANACGIPLEPDFVNQGMDIVDTLDLRRFYSAQNSLPEEG